MIERSISLKELSVENLAWKKEDALLVIQHLMEQEKIILGGDVYKIENKKIAHTCDSWFYQVNLQKTLKINVQESACIAAKFINNYFTRNGDFYCYAIVIN